MEDAASKSRMVQPGVIRVGNEYFVVVEGKAIRTNANDIIDAVDFLIKVAYVFHLDYVDELKGVFSFLELCKGIEKVKCLKSQALFQNVLSEIHFGG